LRIDEPNPEAMVKSIDVLGLDEPNPEAMVKSIDVLGLDEPSLEEKEWVEMVQHQG
jgi:hypothetical protein